MMQPQMVALLAKVQLGDNRHVDKLVVEYWMDTIGDLDFDAAVDALRRFRRERPDTYLQPGHLLALAGVNDVQPDSWRDVTDEVVAASKLRMLEAAGVTEAEYTAHDHDVAWLREKFEPLGAIE